MSTAVRAGLFLFFLTVLAHFFYDDLKFSSFFRRNPEANFSAVLRTSYEVTFFSRQSLQKPVWEVYEIPAGDSTGPHQPVVITHQTGKTHYSLTFRKNNQVWFRFTPDQKGRWVFSTGGAIDITGDRPLYAKGFIVPKDGKWARSATGEAFVPQYVMYDRSDIDGGIQEFVKGHGFTGFHIANLHDFLENPGYFEAVVLKTYRAGGTTHFWVWGDAQRGQTPREFDGEVENLYREIVARLAPLPGWSVGYGFDLREWAGKQEVEAFRKQLHAGTSYDHMVGARGHKNAYQAVSTNLDFFSWEWHRPDYEDYLDHLKHSGGRPCLSADRFRIRKPSRYPDKDYTEALTLQGLWDSFLAGGVGNIWGKKGEDGIYSVTYEIKPKIKTFRVFSDRFYNSEMKVRKPVDNGYKCIGGKSRTICKTPEISHVRWGAGSAPVQVIAVDINRHYEQFVYPVIGETSLRLPRKSEWAVVFDY
ncbi:MAG: hypothetical protein ACOC1Q_01970 [Desulfosalsimonas sp.]